MFLLYFCRKRRAFTDDDVNLGPLKFSSMGKVPFLLKHSLEIEFGPGQFS